MTVISSETRHASCVAIAGHAILIEGRSGSGKSDLALRLIDRGAVLVSDDYTVVRRRNGQLFASPPANIAGQIEVRGVGIVAMTHVEDVPVALTVRTDMAVDRLPEEHAAVSVAGCQLPLINVAPLEPSAPIKVELALANLASAQ